MLLFFNRKVPFFVAYIFSLASLNTVYAQKNAVTLRSIIDSASNHLPVLLEKQELIKSADASIADAKHSRLPAIKFLDEISAASSNSEAGVYFPMSTIPSVSGSVRNYNSWKPEMGNIGMLSAEYDVIDFGLSKAKIQAAKSYLNLVRSDYERQLYVLKWQTSNTYFNLLKAQYQLKIDEQNIKRYTDIFKVIRTLTINGIRAGVDSSQLIAELSRTRMNYNISEGRVMDLQQQLKYYAGTANATIQIDSSLSVLPIADLNVADTASSISTNPFTDYFTKQNAYYKANYLVLQKSFQPRLVLLGGLWARGSSIQYNDQYKALLNGLGYQRYNYATAVSFVYNFFDGIHRRDKLAAYRFKVSAGNYELQQQNEEVNNTILQDNNAILTAEKNLRELPVQLQSAKDAYNQKLAQYNAGIINLIDLTNASYVLYRAQTDYVELLNDWYIANLNKAAITGNLDHFIQTIKK